MNPNTKAASPEIIDTIMSIARVFLFALFFTNGAQNLSNVF
jgi:hypothetical protein